MLGIPCMIPLIVISVNFSDGFKDNWGRQRKYCLDECTNQHLLINRSHLIEIYNRFYLTSDSRQRSFWQLNCFYTTCYSQTYQIWSIIQSWIFFKKTQLMCYWMLLPKCNGRLREFFYFIDEAHFWLNGYAKKQFCRIWCEKQSDSLQKLSKHPEKLTIWSRLLAGGIIGPYFSMTTKMQERYWM